MTKVCNICHREFDESSFKHFMRRGKIDLGAYCKDCERAKGRLRKYKERLHNKKVWKPSAKNHARALVNSAIRHGKMERGKCEKCGAEAEAHHDDYTKPMEVRWLCPKHHAMVHWKPTDSPLVAIAAAIRAGGD